jgi:hypothetical protein
MPLVFLEPVAVRLDPRDSATAMVTFGRNAKGFAAVLVNPFDVGPAFWI